MDASTVTPHDALAIIDHYRNNPRDIFPDIFGCQPWDVQLDIAESVFTYREVAVASCHGIGKSWVAARVALAFLVTHPGGIVITTAPTWSQVQDVIWRELGAAYESSKIDLGGKLNKTQLEFGKDWYALGRSTNKADNFVGYHADHILVIVDEASGVEEIIYEGIRGVTSNENAHTFYIGNPTNPGGTFAKAMKNPLVKKFNVSCWQTPNFTTNQIKNVGDLLAIFTPPNGVDPLEHMESIKLQLPYPGLISPRWVYERFLEWGTDSPMWQSRVLGEFPSQAENALIPLHILEQAASADYREEHGWQIPAGTRMEVGADIARFGSDRTVIYTRRGGHVYPGKVMHMADNVRVADAIISAIDPLEWHVLIKPDDTGLGGGVTDVLRMRKRENPLYRYEVRPVNFGTASSKPEKYHDIRAEMYWTVREWVLSKKVALPEEDEQLIAELANIRYTYTPKQQIKIESKDDYKKRTGKSPDKADAFVLLFAKSAVGSFSDVQTSEDKTAEPQSVVRERDTIASGLSTRY